MKICIFSEAYPPKIGGVSEVVYNLAKYLRKNNVDVDVVTCGTDREEHVIRISKTTRSFFPKSLFSFNKILRNKKYDVIHFHANSMLGVFPLLLFFKKRYPKIMFTFHSPDLRATRCIKPIRANELIFRPRLREYFEKYIKFPYRMIAGFVSSRIADKTTCVSNATKTDCIHDFCIRNGKDVSVVYNGADIKKFNPNKSSKDVREKLKIPKNPIILYLGVFRIIKRVHLLMYAMTFIVKKHPNVVLLIVGGGRGYEKELHDLRDKFNLQKNMIFIRYPKKEHIPKIYNAADIVVLPSSCEGCSITLLEAMSSGKPVIASDISGMSELVEHGKNGLLFEKDNVKQLVENVLFLLENKKLRQTMGKNSRCKVEQKFDWDIIAKAYEKEYEKLIAEKQ